ncbi:MAG: hypothetical protein ACLP3C_14385 [Mycobacterium sp.]|uniref:hypothetical protein n=1 Tax=Mycobacterium sp. TaxID=1785 RepID=UPI003F99756D
MGEAERAELLDNGFVYAGTDYVTHLDCGRNVYVGTPEDVSKALAHLPECPGQVESEEDPPLESP